MHFLLYFYQTLKEMYASALKIKSISAVSKVTQTPLGDGQDLHLTYKKDT